MEARAKHSDVSASLFGAVASAGAGLWKELAEIDVAGPRAQQASMAALSVAISVTVASTMHLPDAWWAAISGFISTQATRPASVTKGGLRVVGTALGATAAMLLVGWLAYDQVACCAALFVVSTIPQGCTALRQGIRVSSRHIPLQSPIAGKRARSDAD